MIDLLILGGRVVDGTGSPWFRADIAVRDGRIVELGDFGRAAATETVDAAGLIVCPGFVDMHTHSDLQLLANPRQEAKIFQGVTLEVLGQDGLSLAPCTPAVRDELRVQLRGWNGDPPDVDWTWATFGEYLDAFGRAGTAVNVAVLVGLGTVRMCVLGWDERAPTETELAKMRTLVGGALGQGAVGASVGLTYAPGMFADDAEIVELCRVVAHASGYYAPHHRNYGSKALAAYADSIAIGRSAGVPVHLTHAHLGFPCNRGRAGDLLAMVDEARAEGVDVTLDTYPYAAGSTYLHAILPAWVHEGGAEAAMARLRDPALREPLREQLEVSGSDGFQGVPVDWDWVEIADVPSRCDHPWVGRRISDLAAEQGRCPVDLVCDLLVDESLGVQCLLHVGNEENVEVIMRHPAHMAGSDGILVGSRPHPRGWGTFARYLETYVRERGVLSWEDAIRKLTSLPARRLGLFDRGILRPGMAADIVCFDPEAVAERATFPDPRQRADGFRHVAVNGHLVVRDGAATGALPGRVLRPGRAGVS